MRSSTRILTVVTIWAAIYLPWLGTPELRSEEGHRVLPAITMLDTGNYLVPQIGGLPYLRKPPLVNWIIAGSFRLFGVRNEWTARLPSTLAVLAVAITLLALGSGTLGGRNALVASVAWLTSFGIIEKGRMIEIDALYVALFAVAFVIWLTAWQQRRNAWLTWFVPWIFLGLGMLAKGPAHLIFFYAIVVAVLWHTRRLRELLQPAHFVGIAVMLAICAAWAVPCFRAVHTDSIAQTWSRELAMRLTGGENDATEWSLNFPRGVGYFLPWVFVLPFIRPAKISDHFERQIARGLAWGAAVPFVIVLLLPGTIPRYILPIIVPAAWLLALAVRHAAFTWRVPFVSIAGGTLRRVLLVVVIFLAVAGAIIFPLRSPTFLNKRPKVRPIAAKVNAALPADETLFAINPLFQPYLFYVQSPIRYVATLAELPPDAHYLLTSPEEKPHLEASTEWSSLRPQLLVATPENRGHSTLLYRLAR